MTVMGFGTRPSVGTLLSGLISVTVVDPPTDSPPLVAIVKPDSDASLPNNANVQLEATATDPDTNDPVTGTGFVRQGDTTTEIGPGSTRA